MYRGAQRGRVGSSQPFRLRAGALACLLVFLIAGIAQAAHVHGEWLPHHTAQAGSLPAQVASTGEESCPLCVAMHSALPVASFIAALIGLLFAGSLSFASGRKPDLPWHFAGFSRPPPAITLL